MALFVKAGNVRNEEERMWDKLADMIWEGNVIPVIGDNLVVDETTIIKELTAYLKEKYELKQEFRTFSELYFCKDFEEWRPEVYEEVSSLIEANQSNFQPTEILKDFLSIEQFPFVITTSVDYTVEEVMKEIWGKRHMEVRSLVFSNDSSENEDISQLSDIKIPTVYYMFGKANRKREHSYVLTEVDMLNFCQSWLSDRHPALLSNVMAEKYLLFLGVNYPDWLIRFLWFSMRSNIRNSGILVDDREIENSLLDFFSRVSINTQTTPIKVLNEIKKRLEKKKVEEREKKFKSISENADFFISYSRQDEEWTKALYECLTKRGFNVWYDRENLKAGMDWESALRRGIRSSHKFVALISESMASDPEDHAYRTEWEIALGHRFEDRSFVIPVTVGTADLYKTENLNLPGEMSSIQSYSWKRVEDVDALAKILIESY